MKHLALVAAALLLTSPAAAQTMRPLAVEDVYNIREVRDPQRSPDGRWVAYTVTTAVKDTPSSAPGGHLLR